MKAELIPERTFIVKIGDKEVRDLRIASRWNGLTELRTPTNQVLIVVDKYSGLASGIREIFGAEPGASETVIVMGSPDLIAELTPAPSKTDEDGGRVESLEPNCSDTA